MKRCSTSLSHCCCSVIQSWPTLCGLVVCGTSSFPVLHHHWSLLKLMSTESVMRFNHLILCHSLKPFSSFQFSSLSQVRLFATPWTAARQASLSITNSRSSLKLTSIESVMPSTYLILCCLLLLLPLVPPSIRVFSNESTLFIMAKVLEFQL